MNIKANSKNELPILPDIQAKLAVYAAHDNSPTGLILIASDAAKYLDIPSSTKNYLVAGYDYILSPTNHFWPVMDLPIDLYIADRSAYLLGTFIKELLSHGARKVTLFQIERGQLLSPIIYDRKTGATACKP